MALLDDVKVALRVTSNAFDPEIDALIAACQQDMRVRGLGMAVDGDDPLAKAAVLMYCKAHFGYDNDEAVRFDESYRSIVVTMLNHPTTYGGAE